VPALEGGGAAFAQGADLGVMPVEQLLVGVELAALASLVRGADRTAGSDVALVGVAGDGSAGEAVDDAVVAGGGQVVGRARQCGRGPDQLAVRVGEELDVDAVVAVLAAVIAS